MALCLCPLVAVGQGVSEQDAKALRKRGVEPTPAAALDFLNQLEQTPQSLKVKTLVARLGADEFRTREAAEMDLTRIGQVAANQLRDATKSKDPEIAMRARRIVSQLNNDDEPAVLAALRVVSEAKSPKALAVLLQSLPALNKTSERVRMSAMKALRSVAAPCQADVLREALRHANAGVRTAAVYALGKLISEEQVMGLSFLLNDRDDWVRVTAAQLMTRVGDRRAVETLIDLLSSDDVFVRRASSRVLRECSEQEFGYSPGETEKTRRQAISAWSKWIAANPDFKPKASVKDLLMAPSLAGSTWRMQYALPGSGTPTSKDHEVVFHADGRLEILSGSDHSKNNDFWSVESDTVTLKINDNYVEYTGALTDHNVMSGTALNIKDVTWTWKATRVDR